MALRLPPVFACVALLVAFVAAVNCNKLVPCGPDGEECDCGTNGDDQTSDSAASTDSVYRAAAMSADGVKPLATAPVKKELKRTTGAENEVKHEPAEQHAGPSHSDASTSRPRPARSARSEKKKFVCDNCGRMFDLRTTLIRHLQDHEYQPYMCHICERLFIKLSNLCNHRQVHFRCRVCQKQFNQKENRPLPTIPPIGSVFRGAS